MNSTVCEPAKKLPQPNVQRQLSQTIGGMSPILRTPGQGQGNSTMTPQVRKTVRKTVRPLPSESKSFFGFAPFWDHFLSDQVQYQLKSSYRFSPFTLSQGYARFWFPLSLCLNPVSSSK